MGYCSLNKAHIQRVYSPERKIVVTIFCDETNTEVSTDYDDSANGLRDALEHVSRAMLILTM